MRGDSASRAILLGSLAFATFMVGLCVGTPAGYLLRGVLSAGAANFTEKPESSPQVNEATDVPLQSDKGDKPSTSPPSLADLRPVFVMSAENLDLEYQKNGVAADAKYLDKVMDVTGVPEKIDKDSRGRYFLVAGHKRLVKSHQNARVMSVGDARAAMQQAALNAKYEPGIYLYIQNSKLAQFVDAKAGNTITLRGICRGMQKRESLDPNYIITIDECTLVDAEPNR